MFFYHLSIKMSSVVRAPKQLESKTKLMSLTTPCWFDYSLDTYYNYVNNVSREYFYYDYNYNVESADYINKRIPIPFTVDKDGVLDINIYSAPMYYNMANGNLVTGSDYLVKEMGGLRKPVSLGTKVKDWISNMSLSADYDSIELEQPGVLTKVALVVQSYTGQTVTANNRTDNYRHFATTATASAIDYSSDEDEEADPRPSSDQLAVGDDNNEWRTSWVFKEPTVIKFKDGGDTYYVKLYSNFAPYRAEFANFALDAQFAQNVD